MGPQRKTSEEALVDAAIAVLAENPGASLAEIALAAGVGRATLHRHFRTRSELIDAISLRAIEETDAATEEALRGASTAGQRLERMLEAVVPLGDRYHFIMCEPQSSHPDVVKAYREELAWVEQLVEGLKREGAVAETVPVGWAVTVIDALIWSAWREIDAGRLAAAEAPRVVHETILNGLRGT